MVLKTTKSNNFWGFMMVFSALPGFSLILALSIFMGLSSHSLIFYWVSLETNMLSFLPLIKSSGSTRVSEISLKYFISQSVASILFLLVILISLHSVSSFSLFLPILILFKMGVPPFHSWLASVVLMAPYKIIFLIFFVQKFIPLHILANLPLEGSVLVWLSLFTFLSSAFVLKNMVSMRVALLMSAWANSVWMVASTAGIKSWVIFLAFYGLFLSFNLMLLYKFNLHKFSSLLKLGTAPKMFCIFSFLNLAGLPPFAGFFAKLFLLKSFLIYMPLMIIVLVLNMSLVVLFSYLALTFYVAGSNFSTSGEKYSGLPLSVMVVGGLALASFPIFMMAVA